MPLHYPLCYLHKSTHIIEVFYNSSSSIIIKFLFVCSLYFCHEFPILSSNFELQGKITMVFKQDQKSIDLALGTTSKKKE